ncbi:hypothetical protein DsansV1_C35g0231021 [Dioscorea sansibarensis]
MSEYLYAWMTMEGLGCSIDMEPRTLNGGELKSAIVAAVDVIQSKAPNEASSIFTEGMKAVISIKGMEKKVEKRDQIHKLVEKSYKEASDTHGGSWDFHCFNSNPDHSPLIEKCCDSMKKREPLSSPF